MWQFHIHFCMFLKKQDMVTLPEHLLSLSVFMSVCIIQELGLGCRFSVWLGVCACLTICFPFHLVVLLKLWVVTMPLFICVSIFYFCPEHVFIQLHVVPRLYTLPMNINDKMVIHIILWCSLRNMEILSKKYLLTSVDGDVFSVIFADEDLPGGEHNLGRGGVTGL